MKNLLYSDYKKRKLFSKFELKRNILKYITRNQLLNTEFYLNSTLELSKLPKNSSPSRIVNRCIFTGRANGVSKKYKLSRLSLRESILDANIIGITKSTW